MSAKEKAKELIEKFSNVNDMGNSYSVSDTAAKQCALIATKGIISAFVQRNGNTKLPDVNYEINYYLQVEKEIQKL